MTGIGGSRQDINPHKWATDVQTTIGQLNRAAPKEKIAEDREKLNKLWSQGTALLGAPDKKAVYDEGFRERFRDLARVMGKEVPDVVKEDEFFRSRLQEIASGARDEDNLAELSLLAGEINVKLKPLLTPEGMREAIIDNDLEPYKELLDIGREIDALMGQFEKDPSEILRALDQLESQVRNEIATDIRNLGNRNLIDHSLKLLNDIQSNNISLTKPLTPDDRECLSRTRAALFQILQNDELEIPDLRSEIKSLKLESLSPEKISASSKRKVVQSLLKQISTILYRDYSDHTKDGVCNKADSAMKRITGQLIGKDSPFKLTKAEATTLKDLLTQVNSRQKGEESRLEAFYVMKNIGQLTSLVDGLIAKYFSESSSDSDESQDASVGLTEAQEGVFATIQAGISELNDLNQKLTKHTYLTCEVIDNQDHKLENGNTLTLTLNFPQQQISVALIDGDITKSDAHYLVNAANNDVGGMIMGGGGVAGAILSAMGVRSDSSIREQVRNEMTWNGQRTTIDVGKEVAVTSPGKLADNGVRQVLHVAGPDCRKSEQKKDRESLLSSAYAICLDKLINPTVARNDTGESRELTPGTSIAFPVISGAIFGYRAQESFPVMLETLVDFISTRQPGNEPLKIQLYTFGQEMKNLYKSELTEAFQS